VSSARSDGRSIVGYRKMWLKIAEEGDLPADITLHVLRHSFASLAAHSADAVLLAAADAVANTTMKLMGEDMDRGSC
jgi:integrase